MKKALFLSAIILATACTFVACTPTQYPQNTPTMENFSFGEAGIDVPTEIKSLNNQYDLIPRDEIVQYTMDISTPDGKMRLKDVTPKQAANLALTNATMYHKCDWLVNPKFDCVTYDGQVLRITVTGRPAVYQRSKPDYEYVPMENRSKTEIIHTNR